MTRELSAVSYQLSTSARMLGDVIKPSPYEGEGWERVGRPVATPAFGLARGAGRGLTSPKPPALWPLSLTSDEVGLIANRRITELENARLATGLSGVGSFRAKFTREGR